MGTSAIVVISNNQEIISNILISSDGYLSGVGGTLLSVLKRKHVNGYTDDQTQYNRVGNFIALFAAKQVIEKTESTKRVNEYFKKDAPMDLSCGGIEFISSDRVIKADFKYLISFNCTPDNPQPPKIKVYTYGFESDWLTVEGFSNLIENGIPEED